MQKTIVSDTSCLILLEKIGELQILELVYSEITVTSIVAAEFGSVLPDWFRVENPSSNSVEKVAKSRIDHGEVTAIALALDLKDCLLIIDDLRGRSVAESLGVRVTGTLGVLIEAKHAGHLDSIKPVIRKIQGTDFRLSDKLIDLALNRAGESI